MRDWRLITGRTLSTLMVLFLLLDAILKLVPAQAAVDTTAQLGWPADLTTLRVLGLILIGSTVLYAWPRTALLGAILLTAYLGGAVATHARVGSPFFSHTFFGVYIGMLLWAGLWLRQSRVRNLLPLDNGSSVDQASPNL